MIACADSCGEIPQCLIGRTHAVLRWSTWYPGHRRGPEQISALPMKRPTGHKVTAASAGAGGSASTPADGLRGSAVDLSGSLRIMRFECEFLRACRVDQLRRVFVEFHVNCVDPQVGRR